VSFKDIGFFDAGTNCPDILIENGDLKAEKGLQSRSNFYLF